ncbi:MAG: KH domain-containing protein, partial [Candidatus Caldarchaeum sp.]
LRAFDEDVEVDMVSRKRAIVKVDREVLPKIIGRRGENIARLEKELGVSLDVEPRIASIGVEVPFEVRESGNSLRLELGEKMAGKTVAIYAGDKFLFSATVSRKGVVTVRKNSEHGRALVRAIYADIPVKILQTG